MCSLFCFSCHWLLLNSSSDSDVGWRLVAAAACAAVDWELHIV